MTQLSPDTITDILTRLPVNSLLRFRCISKPLCSQIDGPDFTKLHLTRSRRRLCSCKLYSLDPHSLHQPQEMANPARSDGWDGVAQVKGSCNGLLCLFKSHTKLWLFSPSTRKQLHLQSPPITFPINYPIHNIVYGFGYDSVHDDYKLLRINHVYDGYESDVYVYSMRLNVWRRVSGFPFRFSPTRFGGVFVCGALHFIVSTSGGHSLVIAVDLAVGPEEEYRYREVPVPVAAEFGEREYCALGVLNERLAMSCCLKDGSVRVWVMKDYGVVESWTVLLCVCLEEVKKMYVKAVTMIGGDEVMVHADDNELFSYDLKSDRVDVLKVLGGYKSFEVDVYVESLVNPY